MLKNFIITQKDKGKRLDKFLTEEFPQFSRNWLQKLIVQEKVLVNDEPAKPKYLLKEKDKIKTQVKPPEKIKVEPDASIKFDIIYEDKDVIVIDKPAGLIVHPSESCKSGTLVNALLAYCPKIKDVGDPVKSLPVKLRHGASRDHGVNDPLRPGIVHRLDKDTSGLIVVAKNNSAFQHLKKQFKSREVEKRYIALAVGRLKDDKGLIDRSIARSKRDPEKMTTAIIGRIAKTSYKVIKRFKNYTLIEVMPKTGRMHQIRVHFKSIRHPLAGDRVYGFKRQPSPVGLKRQFLHAHYLKFRLPSGKVKEFNLSLPRELKRVLNNL